MSDETNVVELEAGLQEIADKLDSLTLLDASKLVKHLEDKWGVSAAAPAAVAAPAAGGGDAAEEKTSFDVILEAAGDKKIPVYQPGTIMFECGVVADSELAIEAHGS